MPKWSGQLVDTVPEKQAVSRCEFQTVPVQKAELRRVVARPRQVGHDLFFPLAIQQQKKKS